MKIEKIQIQYSQPINGYQVSIDFIPKVVYYEKDIIGRGKIYFTHLKTKHQFTIYNPMMGFPSGVLPLQLAKNKKWIVGIKKPLLKLKYNAEFTTSEKYKLGNFGTTKVPFFFQDLNLDGMKELIIPKLNSGQRGIAIFKLYELKNGRLLKNEVSFTNNKPFKELDEMSKISLDKKTITIHASNGSCKGVNKIYIYNPMTKDTPFVYSYLTKEIAYNRKENKCLTKTFKIN